MATRHEGLGGRLPLLSADDLDADQKLLFESMKTNMEAFAHHAGFAAVDERGRFIEPFNALLFSPQVGAVLQSFWLCESQSSSLNDRIRQLIILSVGAVWKAPYEFYAHSAAARSAGLGEDTIRRLVAGEGDIDALSEAEEVARKTTLALARSRAISDNDYARAEDVLGRSSLGDLVVLAGSYGAICALLNVFDVPAPKKDAES